MDEEKCVSGTVSPSDVEGLAYGEYAVYEHFSQELTILKYNEKLDVSLESADDFKLFVIVPLVDGFGAIGRVDKFISPATIDYVCGEEIVLKENGPYAYVKDRKLVIEN